MEDNQNSLPVMLLKKASAPKGGMWEEVHVPFPPYGRMRLAVRREALARYSRPYLLHLAFLSLVAEKKGWQGRWVVPDSPPGESVPDALWYKEGEVWAVEVDIRYSSAKVRRKVSHYKHRYHGQLWGVLSPTRKRTVMAYAWPRPVEVILIEPKEVVE